MYKTTVTVPHITQEMIDKFNVNAPGLNQLVVIPVIDTDAAAKVAATKIVTKQISAAPYEYVKSVDSVSWVFTEDNKKTYRVEFTISGD